MSATGDWKRAVKTGLPIGLGYYAVSFAFGLAAAKAGIAPLTAALISLSNLSSSGQFAGLIILAAKGGMGELFVSVLIVNLRYILMSLALSQKIMALPLWQKLIVGQGVTDEVFALAIREKGNISFPFYTGLMLLPVLGWTLGTFSGAVMGQILPPALTAALGIALYCMFIWIVIPPAKEDQSILRTVIFAAVFSLVLSYVPPFNRLQAGWRITVSSLAAAFLSALRDVRTQKERGQLS